MWNDNGKSAKSAQDIRLRRDALRDALVSLVDVYDDLFVLESELQNSLLNGAEASKFLGRCLTSSLSAQNVVLAAAGMALGGKRVFALAPAPLLVGGAYEQIRSALAIPSVPVNLVGCAAGISAGEDGAMYQMLEDITLIRSLRGTALFVPSDYYSAVALLKKAAALDVPTYTRLPRSFETDVYSKNDDVFEVGDGRILRDGEQVTICACGVMVEEALKAADILAQQDISVEVIDCYCLDPFPQRLVLSSLQRTGCCVTVEEHFLSGGLFEAVAGLAAREYPVPVRPVGIRHDFGQSGSAQELKEYYGLTAAHVVSAAVLAWTMRRPLD